MHAHGESNLPPVNTSGSGGLFKGRPSKTPQFRAAFSSCITLLAAAAREDLR
jgi:hypothetical protein